MKSLLRTALCAWALSAGAAWAEESAQEVARKAREQGGLDLVGLTAELKLVTTDASGTSKEQVLTSSSKKIAGKTCALSRFSSPPGVAGVAVLSVESASGEPADISLYLPKLKRVRKIARSQRGQSFMDTDFSFADLGGATGDDSALRRLPDAQVEGRNVVVLSGSGSADSPYGPVTLYIDKETYIPMKAEYQDKTGKPFKRYRTLKLKIFKERVLASSAVMENLQKGSKTTLEILRVDDVALGDEAFTERALERG
jgi:hypothetical protein